MLRKVCAMTDDASSMLHGVFDRMGLSAPEHDRLLKVARTIADLDSAEIIDTRHLEAVLTAVFRKYWQNKIRLL